MPRGGKGQAFGKILMILGCGCSARSLAPADTAAARGSQGLAHPAIQDSSLQPLGTCPNLQQCTSGDHDMDCHCPEPGYWRSVHASSKPHSRAECSQLLYSVHLENHLENIHSLTAYATLHCFYLIASLCYFEPCNCSCMHTDWPIWRRLSS